MKPADSARAFNSRPAQTNGDGELQFDEFAALWTMKQQQGASSGGEGTAHDAIVVCGYGEIGLRVCEALSTQPSRPPYIAIDRNAARISAGVMNDAPVVYGDGASESLLRATGVTDPRAIVITYASQLRCLECTSRLRKAFPATRIYVRTERQQEVEALTAAGATAVVVETTESAVRFADLLGLSDASTSSTVRRRPSLPTSAGSDEWAFKPPYSEAELSDLAMEVGRSLDEVYELYQSFATLEMNDECEVARADVRDFLLLTASTPMDDADIEQFMPLQAFSDAVGFFDFVRIAVAMGSTGEEPVALS